MKKIISNPGKQNCWVKKRNIPIEKAYSKIAEGIPLIDIRNKQIFYDKCREYYSEIVKANSTTSSPERWNQFEIDRMFGKGLNPTSLKTALNNIRYFVNKINPKDNFVRVVEFGPGSGWSTLMLHNELKSKFPNKKIMIISVDLSPYSIAATQNSLDYYQIPWQTYLEEQRIENNEENYSKITLVLSDFCSFIRKQQKNFFNGYFSSHGTAYLSKKEYQGLFNEITSKSVNDAIIVIDSLDPLYSVQLNSFHLLRCSLNPNLARDLDEYYYGNSLKSNSKYFIGKEVNVLTKVHNKESLLFYTWNNYLLKNLRFRYLIQMMGSIKTTTDIINEYIEDVYPSYLISELDLEKEDGRWVKLEDIPKTPLYISNAGYKLKKI
jgi:hypothetical protein